MTKEKDLFEPSEIEKWVSVGKQESIKSERERILKWISVRVIELQKCVNDYEKQGLSQSMLWTNERIYELWLIKEFIEKVELKQQISDREGKAK